MMTLANYGIGKSKEFNSAKILSKALQIRNKAELLLRQHLRSNFKLNHEQRSEIINLIKDYYSRIPFNAIIWNNYQTKECLNRSIFTLDDKFDPYKARDAFNQIEQMLLNLVHLPWHKEFQRIYTYSGKFRLCISKPLIDAEKLFVIAGFEYQQDSPLHLVLPDEKLPSKDEIESVTSVIFDCLIAWVVCTNIIEVHESHCNSFKTQETKINHFSWIQSYFKERSLQTSDKACNNIQELLGNISNQVAASSEIKVKNVPSNSAKGKQYKQTEIINHKPADRVDYSSNQSGNSILALTGSRDFLRPTLSDTRKSRSDIDYDCDTNINPSRHLDLAGPINVTNGFHQYKNDVNMTKTNDSHHSSNLGNLSMVFDTPHNDREPLLNRKVGITNHNNRDMQKKTLMNNIYSSDLDDYYQNPTDNKFINSSSHSIADQIKNHPLKYNHKKYNNSREDILNNYWSCGSCTFKNQTNSDICEMCRSRRSSL